MNFVEVAGYLGADAEERFTANGKRVVSLRVAARTWKNGKEETIWWRVNIWDDRFDKMLPYLRKGSAVIIFGEMSKPDTYVDREGKTQVSMTLTAEMIKFSPFGKGEKAQENATSQFGQNQTQAGTKAPSHQATSPYENASSEMVSFGASTSQDMNPTNDDLPF